MKTRSINNLFDVLTDGLIDRNSQTRHTVIKAHALKYECQSWKF